MKKFLFWIFMTGLLVLLVWLLITDSKYSLTQKILKPVVEQSCKTELNQSKIWQSTAFFVGKIRQTELQNQICTCVGHHALKDIPSKDLLNALVNQSAKKKLTKQVVFNSLSGCTQDLLALSFK